MAISRISSGPGSPFSGSYQAGDLIVVHVVNTSSATTPTTPAGYTNISSAQQSANSFAMSAFYKFATSGSETYPTITNSTASVWTIYRGVAATPFVNIGGQSGTSASISYSGIATFQAPGSDWVVTFGSASASATGDIGSHPPTATAKVIEAFASNYDVAIFDTGAAVSSYGFNSKTLTTSVNWLTKTTELVAATSSPTPTNQFFAMF